MATTYPLPTLAPTVDANGISIPSYNDVYQSLIAIFQSIYGANIVVSGDSQDGQWIAALAKVINDSNQGAVAVFQSFSPTYAQGVGLSSLVKINGLARQNPSYSTAVGTVTGVAGALITGGVVKDVNGNLWNLPATTQITNAGTAVVTVTAQQAGAIAAPAGSIAQIFNPQYGWQSFVSTADAVIGAAVELDASLRTRQSTSTAIPAQTITEAIAAAVANVTGVVRSFVYENDTGATDANGVPAHSIAVVVEGGAVADIANAIASRKPPGGQTYGTTQVVVYDSLGLPRTINFFILTLVPIYYSLTVQPLTGWVASTVQQIQTALTNYTNALAIGGSVYETQAQAVASLMNSGLGLTFKITAFTLGTTASPTGTADLPILFNEAADCSTSNVVITVL